MRYSKFLISFLVCVSACIGASGAAFADSTADSITKIEAETMLLKAREKQLAVQLQIATRQAEILAKQNEGVPRYASTSASTNQLVSFPSMGEPGIVSIEGLGKKFYATLRLANGSTVEVKNGDVLSNGMRVVTIGPDSVVVETSKKQRIRLESVASTTSAFNSRAYPNSTMAPLPSPSPLFPTRAPIP